MDTKTDPYAYVPPPLKTWEITYNDGTTERVTASTLWTPNFATDSDALYRKPKYNFVDQDGGRLHYKWYNGGLILSVAENQLRSVRLIVETPNDTEPTFAEVDAEQESDITKDAVLATPIDSLLNSGVVDDGSEVGADFDEREPLMPPKGHIVLETIENGVTTDLTSYAF